MNAIQYVLRATTLVLLLAAAPAVSGAVDMFLKIDGIEGESVDKDHKGWINVESFSWGMSGAVSFDSGGTRVGKTSFQDLAVEKFLDKASPELFLAGANGKHIPSVTLVIRASGGDQPVELFRVVLKDVVVSGSSVAGSSGGDRLSESLSLHYAEIEWTYTPTNADGSTGTPVTTSWNVVENTSS